jgi:hypothetical protein
MGRRWERTTPIKTCLDLTTDRQSRTFWIAPMHPAIVSGTTQTGSCFLVEILLMMRG